jgi:uncharacterized protein (DUF1015 family)
MCREEAMISGEELTGEEPFEYVFALAVSFKNFKILPYQRIIKSTNEVSTEELLKKLSEKFHVRRLSEGFIEPMKGEYSILLEE